jgi:hypothetical protein
MIEGSSNKFTSMATTYYIEFFLSLDNPGPRLHQINHTVALDRHILLCDHLYHLLRNNSPEERGRIREVSCWRSDTMLFGKTKP